MGKKLKDFGRKGVKIGEVPSSKGDKVYSIYKDGERYICDCTGFMIRKKCRHIKEKVFALYIKSHCVAPDYELEVRAVTKEEAFKLFRNDHTLYDVDDQFLRDHISEVPECDHNGEHKNGICLDCGKEVA